MLKYPLLPASAAVPRGAGGLYFSPYFSPVHLCKEYGSLATIEDFKKNPACPTNEIDS